MWSMDQQPSSAPTCTTPPSSAWRQHSANKGRKPTSAAVLHEVNEIHLANSRRSAIGGVNKPDIPPLKCMGLLYLVEVSRPERGIKKKGNKSRKMNAFRRLFLPKQDCDIKRLKIDTMMASGVKFRIAVRSALAGVSDIRMQIKLVVNETMQSKKW